VTTKIREISHLDGPYYRLTLDCADIARSASPGQFVMVKANWGADPLLRRPFSIHRLWMSSNSRSREPEGIQILFRVAGKGTDRLAALARGAEIDIIGPLGRGFNLKRPVFIPVFIAGGIGIAPLLFLADQLKHDNLLFQPQLFLGGKTAQDILCLEDFKRYDFSLHITTEDGSMGERGVITDLLLPYLEKVKNSPDMPKSILCACGPSALMSEVIEISRRYHMTCQISMEQRMACGVGACLGCVIELKEAEKSLRYQRVCTEGPVFELNPY